MAFNAASKREISDMKALMWFAAIFGAAWFYFGGTPKDIFEMLLIAFICGGFLLVLPFLALNKVFSKPESKRKGASEIEKHLQKIEEEHVRRLTGGNHGIFGRKDRSER